MLAFVLSQRLLLPHTNTQKFENDHTTFSAAPTSKLSSIGIETPGSPDAENNPTAGIVTQEQASQQEHSSTIDSTRDPSHSQRLQELRSDTTQHPINETIHRVATDPLSNISLPLESPPLQSTSTSAKRGSDHFQVDTALLEMFWYLQSKSGDEAQEFLRHIRSNNHLSLLSTHKWLQDRHTSIAQPGSSSFTALNRPPVNKRAKLVDENPKEQWKAIIGINDQAISSSSKAEWSNPSVTLATVKGAMDMFFKATGLLFYVFPKEQADSIQHDLFNESEYPGDTPFATILNKRKSLHERAQLAEICGMAGVGLLYLRALEKQQPPPLGLSDYFYSTTKQLLDSTIEDNPLRAMKVCALLAMYNIVVKGSVAFAYVGQ